MGQKLKAKKGEISIENNEGRIRLRWRYNGERYTLNLPYAYSPENMHHATVKVTEIKLDILKGCFEPSLKKYKPEIVKLVPLKIIPLQDVQPEHSVIYLNGLADKFKEWTKAIRNINIDNSIDYMGVLKVLEKYVTVPLEDITGKLAGEKWCTSTYNKRLNFLSSFFSWLLHIGEIPTNPLLHVSKRRDKKKKKCERREPLTEDQINDFLEAIRLDKFCSVFASFKHSFYYSFIKFIFITGVRNAEAIGLKVKHLNFESGLVEISEVLARTNKGSHHAARISKGTKTENVRYLPMDDEMKVLLTSQIEGKKEDDLVFPSPRGLSIDDRMLQKRVIKPVLKKMGLGNKDLYSARHSFGTRAVQQGMALTDVAYMMGHATITTAANNYVSVTQPATMLPVIKKD